MEPCDNICLSPVEVRNYFANSNLTLDQFLANPNINYLIRNPLPEFIHFIKDHIDQLIEISFDFSNLNKSALAFKVIQVSSSLVKEAISNSIILQHDGLTLLASQNPSSVALSRICYFTQVVISTVPHLIMSRCGYLLQFFAFLNDVSVSSFFFQTCYSQNYKDVQQFYVNASFSSIVSAEIHQMKPDNLTMEDTIKLENLFAIIQFSRMSSILEASFRSDAILESLLYCLGLFPESVENSRWLTLAYISEEKLFPQLVPMAISILTQPCSTMKNFKVTIFQFLTRAIIIKPDSAELLVKCHFTQIIIRMLVQFPFHTFLQRTAQSFLQAALQNPYLHDSVLSDIIPAFSAEVNNGQPSAFRAMAIEFLPQIEEELSKNNEKWSFLRDNPEYSNYKRRFAGPISNLLNSSYGGPVKK